MHLFRCASVVLLLSVAAATLRLFAPLFASHGASPLSNIDAMYREYRREFSDVPDVTPVEMQVLLAEGGMLVIDVRDAGERAVSVIPGAITAEEFERDESNHRDSSVVVYCTIGYRSGLYAAKLRERGLPALNLSGGILAWCHAGEKVVAPNGEPTNRVHVYGRRWNLLPPEYIAVW